MSSEGKNVIHTFGSRGVKITLYRQENSPNVYYYFRHNGATYKGTTGIKYDPNNEDAYYDKVRDILTEVLSGRFKRKGDIITVSKLLDMYLSAKVGTVKPITMKDYKNRIRFINELWGDRNADSFTGDAFHDEYIKWRRDYHLAWKDKKNVYMREGVKVKGQGYSGVHNVSLNRELRLLVAALSWGKRKEYILRDVPVLPMKNLPVKPRKDMFHPQEYERFKEYLQKNNPLVCDLVRFITHTGLRFPSEINKLVRSDINWAEGWIHVRDRKYKITGNRGQIDSYIPITPPVKEILERVMARPVVGKDVDSMIWIKDDGTKFSTLRRIWKRALLAAGIDRPLTPYTLRHNAITRWVRLGYPLKYIMDMAGHTDPQMITRVYTELDQKDIIKKAFELEVKEVSKKDM